MNNSSMPRNKKFVGPGSMPPNWSAPLPTGSDNTAGEPPPTEQELEAAAKLQEHMLENLGNIAAASAAPHMRGIPKPAPNARPIPVNHNFMQTPKTSHVRANPLAGFFRKPGISVRLPSGVGFYPTETVELTPTGELEIFPLTLADELILKTPDALLNGAALEQVISSCAPGVKQPKRLLSPDLDVILLGIRYATYGNTLNMESKCPKCGTENAYGINIQQCLESIVPMEHVVEVHLSNGLRVIVQPFDFEAAVKAAAASFEQAKILQVLQKDNVSEQEKMLEMIKITKKISELQCLLVASGIQEVVLPSNESVRDPQMILEWVNNTSRNDLELLEQEIKKLNMAGVPREYDLECSNCGNQWKAELSYDPTSFFGKDYSK